MSNPIFRTLDSTALDAVVTRLDFDQDVRDMAAELLHLRGRGILTLRWKRIGAHRLSIPARARPEEAGHDLAVIVEPDMRGANYGAPLTPVPGEPPRITVYPGALVTFHVGWAVEIPPSHFGLVHVRSSVGKQRWVLASSGVIDPTYRGEIKVPLLYLGADATTVTHGDRMAQMMIVPRPNVEDVEVGELTATARGTNGFGSTGK